MTDEPSDDEIQDAEIELQKAINDVDDGEMPELVTTRDDEVPTDAKPFKIDGVVYHITRPKTSVIAGAAPLLMHRRGAQFNNQELAAVLQFVNQMCAYVVEEPDDPDTGEIRGQALLWERLSDPKDNLDLEDLIPLLARMVEGWAGRPTVPSRGSQRRRKAR
jgi:hypothetical protein